MHVCACSACVQIVDVFLPNSYVSVGLLVGVLLYTGGGFTGAHLRPETVSGLSGICIYNCLSIYISLSLYIYIYIQCVYLYI